MLEILSLILRWAKFSLSSSVISFSLNTLPFALASAGAHALSLSTTLLAATFMYAMTAIVICCHF